MIKALELAKLPAVTIKAIKQLSRQRENILHINGLSEGIITEIIKYLNGIFQGHSLSVLLFIIHCVNLLPFLLIKLNGYSLGTGYNRINLTYKSFVDDLKLYGSTLDII